MTKEELDDMEKLERFNDMLISHLAKRNERPPDDWIVWFGFVVGMIVGSLLTLCVLF